MKRWLILGLIILLAAAAIAVSESRKVDVPASPAALLYLVADTEHELTRMPVNFTRMSDQDEIRIGNDLARLYGSNANQKIQLGPEFEIENYLAEVGRRLASNARRRLPYKFHYIHNMGEINAFALPGGHVYVTEGMLSLMDSEDELAAVMGHEIEHIDHYHCAERVQQQEALRKIPLGGLIEIPISAFEAGYSKDQELEADREGTRLAVQAGYSPEGAIRIFEKFQQLYREYQSKPKNPAEEAAEVTAGTLDGYFRTHPLTSERLSQIQKLIASENWPPRAERDLAIAYIFLTTKAQRALAAHRYAEAEQLAVHSLKLHPDQFHALDILARSQFAQAEFADSAATYRKILEAFPGAILPEDSQLGVSMWRLNQLTDHYAEALAAADRQTAAGEFRQWSATLAGEKPSEIDIDAAGLALLAGDSGPASKLEPQLGNGPGQPEQLAQMGWWHYRSGDYPKALELLAVAYQRRPNAMDVRERLAWVYLELQRNADALQLFGAHTAYTRTVVNSPQMVVAVAFWRADEADVAMRNFSVALAAAPEWANPKWVSALYSPTVVQAISEMQQESQRRQQQHRQQ